MGPAGWDLREKHTWEAQGEGGAAPDVYRDSAGRREADRGRGKQQHQATGGGPLLQPVGDDPCQDPTCNKEGSFRWDRPIQSPGRQARRVVTPSGHLQGNQGDLGIRPEALYLQESKCHHCRPPREGLLVPGQRPGWERGTPC